MRDSTDRTSRALCLRVSVCAARLGCGGRCDEGVQRDREDILERRRCVRRFESIARAVANECPGGGAGEELLRVA